MKLAIIYGTGFGNIGIIAKAIEEGARNTEVEVTVKESGRKLAGSKMRSFP